MNNSIKILLFFAFSLCISKLSAQDFEGALIYKTDIELSPVLSQIGMTKQTVLAKMREEATWSDSIETFYKQGNYYTVKMNGDSGWEVYRSDSNKVYSPSKDNDIYIAKDASVEGETKLFGKP